MSQTGLTDFGGDGDQSDRVVAEAQAVAGRTDQSVNVVDAEDVRFPDAAEYVELMVTQVDYTIEGQGSDEYPVIHVFGRTADNEAKHVRVLGFRPYFYAPTDSLDDQKLDRETITGTDEGYQSIRGEELTKIFGRTPRDVGEMRDEFDHFEADILFPNRFLIDKDINEGIRVPARYLDADEEGTDGGQTIQIPHDEVEPTPVDADLRVNFFDIEVDDRHGFPEEGEEPIICLTSHDSYRDEYVAWLYEAPEGDATAPEELGDYGAIREGTDVQVRSFDTEEAMLSAFLDYLDETDPDVASGWNCLPADSKILMADGRRTEIRDIEIGDRVLGSDEQMTTVAEVTNKWKSEKEVRRFELADGTSLRASDDHRVMVGDDEQVDWKKSGDISHGDYVLKPRTLTVDNPQVPTLTELIPDQRQRFTRSAVKTFKDRLPYGAVSELATSFDVERGGLWKSNPTIWNFERCQVAAERYDIPLPDGGIVTKQTLEPVDRELTEQELYLAGLVLTDGSMSRSDGIRFYNTREELHEQFPGDNHLQPDGTGCYKQNVLDFTTMRAFNGIGIPFGDKNAVDVDLSTVYEMPEQYIAQFLAGVVDGDGNVFRSITVAAENTTIGDWYVDLFRRLGIYAYRNGTTVRIPDAAREINRFKDHVQPHMNHSKKVTQIEDLEGGKSGRTENIPYALFEAETGTDEKRIGNDKHRRGINLKRHETLSEEWDEYVFVEVDNVETVGVETTYDIETTTHNFFAEDCLVHNCDDFDIPYLLDRVERLNSRSEHDLDPNRLSRIDEVWRSGWGGPNVKGRVVFDLLYAYKRTQFTELESYRLDAVAELELDVGKERFTGDLGDLWEQDPEQLLKYNLRDVELCVEIDRKQEVIPFWNEVRTFVGCKLEDAPTPGDAVDVYVLHKVHGEFALPSKGQTEGETYEGGAVFDPITGLKENVTVLDLKCFSSDTSVLTPAGPKQITELSVGDDIYTLDPETFECEVDSVAETHHYQNKYGELHHLSGNTHDFKVTENHRFLISRARNWDTQTPADFDSVPYRDIPDYERFAFPQHNPMSGPTPATFDLANDFTDQDSGESDSILTDGSAVVYFEDDLRTFRNRMPEQVQAELDLIRGSSQAMGLQQAVGKYLVPLSTFREHRAVIEQHADEVFLKYGPQHRETPLTFDMDDWLALLGWYVTEGSIDHARNRVTIHQRDERYRERIQSLLERLEINYNVDDRGFNISNYYLTKWLENHCGAGFENKRLPDWVFDLDASLLEPLLETMICGDGSRTDSGLGKFWTKSEQLKDAVADIALRCGQKPTVSEQRDGTWYVSIGKRGSFKKETNATVDEHDGDVYCVTAENNHVILAGRNGNYQWVGQSLYPMCMVTTNASPETKVDPQTYDGETYHAPNGIHFRKNPDGIIREMVDELLEEREQKKSKRNEHEPGSQAYEQFDRQQASVKVIMNSLYGVLGWDRFRLYDEEMGAAVTATGRDVIEYTEQAANEIGYDVAYGDTDSVMLELGQDYSKDEAIETSFEIEEHINDSYDEFALERLNAEQHRFQIEFEKLYRRFFQAGKKKRYAGHIVWKEGKDVDDIDITGFEYKRSDIAPITKDVQKRVLEMIVTGEDTEEIKEYLNQVITDFQKGNLPLDEIGVPGGIGKRLSNYDTDTAQVRGAKYANLLLGTNFQRGSKPKRLYLKKVHPAFFRRIEEEEGLDPQTDPLYAEFKRDPDVICFEYADQIPEEFEIDWDKMLEKTLKGPIERVIEALGMSWEEVKTGQEQTGLGSFT